MLWTRSRALSAAAASCRQGQAALRAVRQLPGAGCMSRDLACIMQPGQPGACARRDRRLRDARCVLAGTSAWLPWLHASAQLRHPQRQAASAPLVDLVKQHAAAAMVALKGVLGVGPVVIRAVAQQQAGHPRRGSWPPACALHRADPSRPRARAGSPPPARRAARTSGALAAVLRACA
jgi:hypothetical protein